jgi:superfamily I DNA/RNA helicase
MSAQMASFDDRVIEVVRKHGPIKAAEIARKLAGQLKTDVTRSDVNSVLYRHANQLQKDDDTNAWVTRIVPAAGSSAAASPPSGAHPRAAAATPRAARPAQAKPRKQRRVSPSGEQVRLIEFDVAGNLLIRGEAGSGKTTVLAARAERLAGESLLPALFLTYNRALARYVNGMVEEGALNLVVRNFHAWTRDVAAQLGLRVRAWVQQDERETLLTRCIQAVKLRWPEHRLLQMPMGFWHDELEWIFGRGLRTQAEYLVVERRGRGQTIQVRREEDRPVVWAVLEEYRATVSAQGCWDVEDPGGLLRAAFECGGSRKVAFSHIFIDEVQDFDKSWLEAVAMVTAGPMTMAGDLAQRIYRRSFSWREVGIELHGSRSQRLNTPFRTTMQIVLVAQHLATNPDLKDDADYLPPSLPERQGPLVQRIAREARASVVEGVTRWVLARLAEDPDCTVLVAVPTSRGHQEIVRSLRDRGVAAGFAKGDDLADQVNQVQVTTYHQAKGLEWDHVVLMDLTDDRMPGYFVSHIEDPEERLEAENRVRRLVYVALTRARTSALLAGCSPFCRYFRGVPANCIQEI